MKNLLSPLHHNNKALIDSSFQRKRILETRVEKWILAQPSPETPFNKGFMVRVKE